MKTFGFAVLAIGFALAALPLGSAQGQTTFALETHSEGAGGYFTIEGQTQRNPTLNVAPGESITITITAADGNGVHNICVEPTDTCSEFVTAEGDTQTLTFTAPTSGTVEYYCQPHVSAGMKGLVSAASATTTPTGTGGTPTPATTGGGENGAPGFGLVGALVALAAMAIVMRRK